MSFGRAAGDAVVIAVGALDSTAAVDVSLVGPELLVVGASDVCPDTFGGLEILSFFFFEAEGVNRGCLPFSRLLLHWHPERLPRKRESPSSLPPNLVRHECCLARAAR